MNPPGCEYYSNKRRGLLAWLCYRLAELSLVIIFAVFVGILFMDAERLQPFLEAIVMAAIPSLIAVLAVGFMMARKREKRAENDRRHNIDKLLVIEQLQEAIHRQNNPHEEIDDDQE